jgi:hypothetical protein
MPDKLCRRIFTVEILGDEDLAHVNLYDYLNDYLEDYSVSCSGEDMETLTPMQMAEALERQGSDRDFLLGEECRYKQPHLKVEFDLNYSGGDYSKVGKFVHIPWGFVEQYPTEAQAFTAWTGYDDVHIITHYQDEEYTHDGRPYSEAEKDGEGKENRGKILVFMNWMASRADSIAVELGLSKGDVYDAVDMISKLIPGPEDRNEIE